MTMMIMMMLMMMIWKDDADGALDPWSCFLFVAEKKVDILLWLNLFFGGGGGGASSVLNLLFILRAPLISLQFSIEFLEKYCSLTFLSIYRSCITTSTDTERISKLRGVSTKICRLRSEATRQEKSSQNCMV